MKLKNIFLVALIGYLLSGCNTIGMLADTKNEFKQGNYIFGTFMGLSSITFGPIVDVFTLGGLLDGEQAVDVWSGAATVYTTQQIGEQSANQAKLNAQIQAQQQMAIQAKAQSFNNTLGTKYVQAGSGGKDYSFHNGNESGANSNTSNKKFAQPVTNCISLDRTSNSLADFFINRCSQNIWVEWVDQKYCKTGCADSLTSRVSINKTIGHVDFVACPYGYSAYLPNAPRSMGYKWKGESQFECVSW